MDELYKIKNDDYFLVIFCWITKRLTLSQLKINKKNGDVEIFYN